MRKILLILLITSIITHGSAAPDDLFFSDEIQEGQKYTWLVYPEFYDQEEILNARNGINYTIEVITTPGIVDVRGMIFSNYFNIYVNNSKIHTSGRHFYDQFEYDWEVFIHFVIVNQTINYFENESKNLQDWNYTNSEGLSTRERSFENPDSTTYLKDVFDISSGIRIYGSLQIIRQDGGDNVTVSRVLLHPSPNDLIETSTKDTSVTNPTRTLSVSRDEEQPIFEISFPFVWFFGMLPLIIKMKKSKGSSIVRR